MALTGETLSAVQARIQGEIGQFLGCKQTLLRLQSSSDPSIKSQADKLMVTQLTLEEGLPGTLATIERVKSGTWTYGDIITLTAFAVSMEDQISAVNKLNKGQLTTGMGTGTLALIGIGAAGLFWLMKRR